MNQILLVALDSGLPVGLFFLARHGEVGSKCIYVPQVGPVTPPPTHTAYMLPRFRSCGVLFLVRIAGQAQDEWMHIVRARVWLLLLIMPPPTDQEVRPMVPRSRITGVL